MRGHGPAEDGEHQAVVPVMIAPALRRGATKAKAKDEKSNRNTEDGATNAGPPPPVVKVQEEEWAVPTREEGDEEFPVKKALFARSLGQEQWTLVVPQALQPFLRRVRCREDA